VRYIPAVRAFPARPLSPVTLWNLIPAFASNRLINESPFAETQIHIPPGALDDLFVIIGRAA
jgi:hypothetical protein